LNIKIFTSILIKSLLIVIKVQSTKQDKMPLSSKGKRKSKNQVRNAEGKYESKKVCQDDNIIMDDYNHEFFGTIEHGVVNYDSDELKNIDAGDSELDAGSESGWDDVDDMEEEIKINQKLKELKLEWKENVQLEKTKRGPYMRGKTPKSTYYDKYGPSGSFTKAAAGNEKITSLFKVQTKDPEQFRYNTTEEALSDSEEEKINLNNYLIKEKITELKDQLEKKHKEMNVIEYNQKRAIYEYLVLLDDKGCGRIDASLQVAKKVFIGAGPWKAQKIRYAANYWLLNNKLPMSRHGKHQKTVRLIDDEDVAEKCQVWIREKNYHATPSSFKTFIEQNLLPNIGIAKKKDISLSTAKRWLNILGYTFKLHHQGMYYDGHEREDVLQYRKVFLEKMFDHEKYMSKYEGETMDRIIPNLPEGEKERILVVHDESIFYSNDGKRGVWTKNGEMPLRKKGNGRSIMVSEFLTEVNGRLCLQQADIEKHPYVPEEAQCYLKPGINQDGYWTAEHLLEQIEYKAIPIFEALYPDCIAVFAFDNSSNHAAFRNDALVAKRMNLKPGGKQPVMRDTYFGEDKQPQSMVFPSTHPDEKLRNKPKGIKQVLIERGKWSSQGLILECKECKENIKDDSRKSCCACCVLSLEPDFLAQKGAIEELIENAGHKCIFFPKFHCELNFIERYWGAAKRYLRENCDYSWEGLKKTVPESLESVPLITKIFKKVLALYGLI